jgi:branched-chain amino acid transport system substrate-binding protein
LKKRFYKILHLFPAALSGEAYVLKFEKLILLLLILSLLSMMLNSCVMVKKKPILLGAIYNLHGAQGSLDNASARGLQLAIRQINAQGGVKGRQISLFLEDGYSQPDSIAAATRRLLQKKVLTIIGFSDTDMLQAALPYTEKAGIPFITPGATAPLIVQKAPHTLFLSCFSDNEQAAAVAEFARQKWKAGRAAIFYDESMQYATRLAKYFTTCWKAQGGEIIVKQTFQAGQENISTLIAQSLAKQHEIDIFYIAAAPDEAGHIIREVRNAGLTQPILGGDAFDTPQLWQSAGNTLHKLYFSTHAWMHPGSGYAQMDRFIHDYKDVYDFQPENAFTALGFDAGILFFDACQRAKSLKPKYILHALETTTNLQGLTGTISFSGKSHIPQKEVMIVRQEHDTLNLEAVISPVHIPKP